MCVCVCVYAHKGVCKIMERRDNETAMDLMMATKTRGEAVSSQVLLSLLTPFFTRSTIVNLVFIVRKIVVMVVVMGPAVVVVVVVVVVKRVLLKVVF